MTAATRSDVTSRSTASVAGNSAHMRIVAARLGPRAPWLLAYLVVNVIAAIMMLGSGYLMGDASELRVEQHSNVYVALAITLGTYVLVAWWMFNVLTRVRVFRRSESPSFAQREQEAAFVGVSLLVLQTAFMLFNLYEGINVAGATNLKSDSPLNLIFVLLQPDVFFFVYYGYYRETRFFKYNVAIYVLSNFLRGWSGFLLTIAFFEWCRAYRRGSLRARTVAAIGALALLGYPLLLALKWSIRLSGGATLDDFQRLVETVAPDMGVDAYFDLVSAGVMHIIERLQQVSNVAAIAQKQDALLELFSAGVATPFWWEGLPQLALSKGFGITQTYTLPVLLTDVVAYLPGSDLGSWSMNPGLAGWIILEPLWTPFLLLYVGLLCFMSVAFAPGCQHDGLVRDMLWYAWLVLLIPGWFTAFTGVICALVVLNALRGLHRRIALQ